MRTSRSRCREPDDFRGTDLDLNDLTAYAEEKYQLAEQHKWADFPGFSVLADPITGKWVALLMRQWDQETGTEKQRCDLKCGQQSMLETPADYLSPPFRMKGRKWLGVSFDERTEPALVFRLFDRALRAGEQRGYTLILEDRPGEYADAWADTPLPAAGALFTDESVPEIPPRILEMMRLYEPGDGSLPQKCKNFYRQGRFMEDYEDDLPWYGEFSRYFPCYHDLNLRQLRGYFTWRTELRRGRVRPVTLSFAYIYLYELLCGIGTSGPEESLEKLREFDAAFLGAGYGDEAMKNNLQRWMPEYAVLHDLPADTIRRCADPAVLARDRALAILRQPEDIADDEVYAALCVFAGGKFSQSPVMAKDAARGRALFAALWRQACRQADVDFFALCFGQMRVHPWNPLSNAVHWEEERHGPAVFELDPCRRYLCRGGIWEEERYDRLSFDERRFQALLHEGDRLFRKHLKTGHTLRVRADESWATPFAEAAIEEDRRAQEEAARPKITIDFSGLAQIRLDAGITRDSLLTEEEKEDGPAPASTAPAPSLPEETAPAPGVFPVGGLDETHRQILSALLRGESVREMIKEKHLMPSVVTDTLNEALFDLIGDNALSCDGTEIRVVEDYREELEENLGGYRQ